MALGQTTLGHAAVMRILTNPLGLALYHPLAVFGFQCVAHPHAPVTGSALGVERHHCVSLIGVELNGGNLYIHIGDVQISLFDMFENALPHRLFILLHLRTGQRHTQCQQHEGSLLHLSSISCITDFDTL